MLQHKIWLYVELISVFIGLPLWVWSGWFTIDFVLIPVVVVLIPAIVWLIKAGGWNQRNFWSGDLTREKYFLRIILVRFVMTASMIIAFALMYRPEKIFDLPASNVTVWMVLAVFYPLLSVYPQELLYRGFFFQRYQRLFTSAWLMIIVSSLCFAWMHIVFESTVSLMFTLCGGLYFSHTYARTRSLRLVCLEHSLYGELIFISGFAEDFLQASLFAKIMH